MRKADNPFHGQRQYGTHAEPWLDSNLFVTLPLLHRLWIDLTSLPGQEQLHHRDVIHVALRHLAADLAGPGRPQLLATVVAPRAAPHAPQAAIPRPCRRP